MGWNGGGSPIPGYASNPTVRFVTGAAGNPYTYVVPAGVSLVRVHAVAGGGGGAGGGSQAAAAAQGGGDGGNCGQIIDVLRPCVAGETITVNLGAGGAGAAGAAAGGAPGNKGGSGGNTTVAIPSSGTITVNGAPQSSTVAANTASAGANTPYAQSPGSVLGLTPSGVPGAGGPSAAIGNGVPGIPLTDIAMPGGGGAQSSTTNGGAGGTASNGLGGPSVNTGSVTGTANGGNGANAPANTGSGGGGGGGGTGGTGTGGAGGNGADGYVTLRPEG